MGKEDLIFFIITVIITLYCVPLDERGLQVSHTDSKPEKSTVKSSSFWIK